MAWPFVSGAASASLVVTKAVTAGDFLVVFYVCNSNGALTPTISDNGSTPNSWTPVSLSPFNSGLNNCLAMWYCIAKVTGSITVTIAGGGASFNEVGIGEWTPPFPVVIEEVSASVATTAGTAAADGELTGSVTTVADGDLIVSLIIDSSALPTVTQFTAGSNPNVFTKRATASNDPGGAASGTFAVADFVQAAHGAINPTWTAANADQYAGITVAFKAVVANVASSRIFRAGRGPGAGPAMRRMAPQQFPTPGPTDAIIPGPQIQTLRARGLGIGPRLRRMFPQQYPGISTLTTLAPTEGAITIAGVAASITLTLAAVAGAIVIAGNAPSITTTLQATEGAIIISGNAASTTTTLAASPGAITIGGSTPTLSTTFAATDGAVVINGNAPSIGAATFSPTEGAITIDGNAPSVTLIVPTAITERFSGGWEYARLARKRLEEELRTERERWGILPKAAQIVSAVAIRQADALDLDAEQRLKELERELELAGVRYHERYLELLNLQRQRLIDAEIRGFFEAQEALDEENKRRLMLLLAFLS